MLSSVLVTGGASGLGRAVVRAVEEAGGKAVVLDRRPPVEAGPFELVDLEDVDATTQAVQRVGDAHGLDAVVTCAGVDACGRLVDVPADEWGRVIAVNLVGTAAVARAALPYLQRSHGTLVTVASTLGLRPASDATAYCASKFGVIGFTRALALEVAGSVRVTCLVPGGMRTPFFDGRSEQYRPGADAHLMDPDAVAATVLGCLLLPGGLAVRELVLTVPDEPSWP